MELFDPLSSAEFPAQVATFSATAASTAGWNTGPEGVMVWSDEPCYVKVGVGAVATANDTPIPPMTPIPFKVPITATGIWRVSALQISTGGNVYCKPINSK